MAGGEGLMARQMVSDDHELYRVIVVRLPQKENPNWQRGLIGPGNPRFVYEGKPFESTYGPYNSIGAARGQLTFRTLDAYGEPARGVVGGRIQKATTTWEDVR
ncbi:hypothetical protein [Streptomyces niveus]|uniref:hypothetical protein n=1 Tax=Streptomyces niveus TaxID=193462 RepID=UPI0036462373